MEKMNSKIKALIIASLLISSVFAVNVIPVGAQLTPHQESINQAIEDGLSYLRNNQNADGSWGGGYKVGETSLGVLCFLSANISESDPDVISAINYILSRVQPDGSIWANSNYRNYETSCAIMALGTTGNSSYNSVIEDAKDYVISCQNTENPDDWYYGGFGKYGYEYQHADLSNTQFSLIALRAAEEATDVAIPSDVWDRAVIFVSRCQNDMTLNPEYALYDDGGFIYLPSSDIWFGGYSYGSMTGAGIWSLKLCGLSTSDPRIQAGLDWFENYYDYDSNPTANPGMQDSNMWLYYYLWTAAKAFIINGITTEIGGLIPVDPADIPAFEAGWYYDFSKYLVENQRDDGSWPGGAEEGVITGTEFALLVLEREVGAPLNPEVGIWTDKTSYTTGETMTTTINQAFSI